MAGKKDSATLKWICSVAGPGGKWVLLLTLVRIAQGGLAILYAYALRNVVNCATAGNRELFLPLLSQFIALVVTTVALQALGRYFHDKSHATLEKAFRLRAFSQLLQRSYAKVSAVHTGDWMNRITSDTNAIIAGILRVLPDLCGMLVRLLGAFFALMSIVPQVALLLLPAGLLMIGLSYILRGRLKQYHKDLQRADGTARSFLQEQLGSLPVIHSFTQEDSVSQQAGNQLDGLVAARMKRSHFSNLSNTALTLAMTTAQVIGIGVCCAGILDGTVSYGTMSAVMYLINLLGTPFAQLSGSLSQYYAMIASGERLIEIENFPADHTQPPLPTEQVLAYYQNSFAGFGLEEATFSYEEDSEKQVLRGLNLNVQKGQFVAFTGQSGCGKSTAMKILLSLYPLDGGNAYLQNTDGSREPLDARARGLFAYVPQGNLMTCGTVRESLAFGDEALMGSEEQLQSALKVACADDFVNALPQGMDTPLGEHGSGLSEGQLQRLSIARAILSQRPVLLLDESTSALDETTEEKLLQNLRAMTDRTVVIITHRKAALSHCDQIIPFAAPGV